MKLSQSADRPPVNEILPQMIKRLVSWACVLLLLANQALPAAWSEPEGLRVIILPFKNITQQPEDEWLGESFSESLTTGLTQVRSLQLIERNQMKMLLQEQAFSQSLYADDKTAPQLGKMLGAKVVVLGNFQKMGGLVVINARFVDVETGQIDSRLNVQVEGKVQDLFALQKQLAEKLITLLKVSASDQDLRNMGKRIQSTQSTKAHEFYIKGRHAVLYATDASIVEAIALYKQALMEDPDYALALAGLAEVYAVRGKLKGFYASADPTDPEKAMQYARQALEQDPTLPEAYRALAQAFDIAGNKAAALETIQEALKRSPQSTETILTFIDIKYDFGLHNAAKKWDIASIKADLTALNADFEDPWVQYVLAAAYFSQLGKSQNADYQPVIDMLEQVRRKLPDFPQIPMLLGVVYWFKGDVEAAQRSLNESLALQPDNFLSLFVTAQIMMDMGHEQKAFELLTNVIRINPDFGYAYMTLGFVYMARDEDDKAMENFKRAATLLPESSAAFLAVGRWHLKKKNYPKAIRSFERALDLWEKTLEATPKGLIHMKLGDAYREQGDFIKALFYYQQMTQEHYPYDGLAHQRMADLAAAQQKYAEALQHFNAFLKLSPQSVDQATQQDYRRYYLLNQWSQNPEDVAVLNDLGQLALTRKALDLAGDYFTQALKLDPGNPTLHYNMGCLHLETKEWAKALAAFEQAVALKPGHTYAWFNLGLAHYQLGDKAKAKEAWEKALGLTPTYTQAREALGQL